MRFLLRSTNEHGIHSPFVFSLVTKGLYASQEEWRGKKKSSVFMERIVAYFKPKKAVFFSNKPQNLDVLSYSHAEMKEGDEVDFIFIDETSRLGVEELAVCLSKLKNDAFVVIDKRARQDATQALWDGVVKSDAVSVSIDFYFYGMGFVRKEQLKQHFIVRL